jgi:hypothetical protein
VDEVDSALDGALEEALRTFDDGNQDAQNHFDSRWRAFGTNLRSGAARVVVVLDEAPTDLRRVVQFLYDRSHLDIRLVTVSSYVDSAGGAFYVSTVLVGESEATRAVPEAPVRSEGEFLSLLGTAFPDVLRDWESFAEAVRTNGQPLQLGNFDMGAPYVYAPGPDGPLKLLRMSGKAPKAGNAPPLIRDSLYAGVWNTTPAFSSARTKFREDFLSVVPNSRTGGRHGRVEAPVRSVVQQREAVILALKRLVQDVQSTAMLASD